MSIFLWLSNFLKMFLSTKFFTQAKPISVLVLWKIVLFIDGRTMISVSLLKSLGKVLKQFFVQNRTKPIEFNTIRKMEMEWNFKAVCDKLGEAFLANIWNSRVRSQPIHSVFHRRYQWGSDSNWSILHLFKRSYVV